MPVLPDHPSPSRRRLRVTRTLGCRTRQPSDRRWTTFHNWRCASIGEGPTCNFVLSRKPHVRLRSRVSEKSVETSHAVSMTRDAVMKTDDHHATTVGAFFVQLIEFIAQCLFVGRGIPPHEWEGHDVVQMKRVGNRDEVAAFERHNEWLIAARLVDVVEEAQTLQDIEGSGRITHSIGIPADRPLTRGPFNALHPIGGKAALC